MTSSRDAPVRYALIEHSSDGEDDDAAERSPSAVLLSDRAGELQRVIEEFESREAEAQQCLRFWEKCWERRRRPVEDELEALDRKKQDAMAELAAELERIKRLETPQPPGPQCLSFVESDWFGALCNLMVALNLTGMAFGHEVRAALGEERQVLLDNAFLLWYVAELTVKAAYFQVDLLFGPVNVVWWNWMDLVIVVSGALEQWLMPLLTSTGLPGIKLNLTGMRALRFLRFLRVLRALKLVRVFVQGDFGWVQGTTYEIVGTVILGVNSLTMAVELDNAGWPWWSLLNGAFLAFYTFDILCRLKFQGLAFFYDRDTLGWNYLDFIIVCEGVVDQWVLPVAHALVAVVSGQRSEHESTSAMGMLKMLRLLRILRLARLCRSIPPLYKLMQGVAEALGGLRWVMVLAILVLYAGSIVFTTMVSQELITGDGDDREEAIEFFGTVPRALYSLFKIMNGELEPSEALSSALSGRLLLVGFIICSNWAILAILTSVVSDNMISSSAAIAKKEAEREEEERLLQTRSALAKLFEEIDDDNSGTIEESEWRERVMEDRTMIESLQAVTHMGKNELKDAFEAVATSNMQGSSTRKNINFEEFVQYLVKDAHVPADRRSVLKIRQQLELLERDHLSTRTKIEFLSHQFKDLGREVDFSSHTARPDGALNGHGTPSPNGRPSPKGSKFSSWR